MQGRGVEGILECGTRLCCWLYNEQDRKLYVSTRLWPSGGLCLVGHVASPALPPSQKRVWGSNHGNIKNKRGVKKIPQPHVGLQLLGAKFVLKYFVTVSPSHNASPLQTPTE
jgi:hypothetical protein